MRTLTLTLLLLTLATPVLASDGVLEINQACAVETGCFPGDTPGFPVTITARGSYRLTSNLTIAAQFGVDAIDLEISGVTIDLNGFELIGPRVCMGSGSGITCVPEGFGPDRGIEANGRDRVTVYNGRVSGFSGGVWIDNFGHIEAVIAEGNSSFGLRVNGESLIRNSAAYRNGGEGIEVGAVSVVEASRANENLLSGIRTTSARGSVIGNTVASNGGSGIVVDFHAVVTRNSATSNGGYGISTAGGSVISENAANVNTMAGITAGDGCMISNNAAFGNPGHGILAGDGSTVSGNSVYNNGGDGIFAGNGSIVSGNTAMQNGDDGIHVEGSSMVRANAVHQNANYGLNLDASSRSGYTENVVSGNSLGTVNPGREFGENLCEGNTTCP